MALDRSALRYLVVGLGNTVLDLALFTGLAVGLDVRPVLANVVSTVVVMTISFFVNRSWVFGAERAGLTAYAGFVGVTLFSGLVLQSLVILGVIDLADAVAGQVDRDVVAPAAKVVAMGVGMVSNFLGYRYVFARFGRPGGPGAPARPGERSSTASSSTTTANP